MSVDFFGAFAKLPRPQQRRVNRLIHKLRENPMSPGLNYERIRNARSPKMHSVRIDQAYRAIVYDTGQGGLHLLLWAAKHDDAYAWAMRKECAVNPETGAVQVFASQPDDSDQGPAATSSTTAAPSDPSAFDQLKDRQLVR